MADLADRFLTSWKHLEQHLCTRWNSHAPRQAVSNDMDRALAWAREQRLISVDSEDFLRQCRNARNAYAHVAFDGYVGPVTLPPEPVVRRLERITESLRTPVRVERVSKPALTCEPTTPLRDALHEMRQNDFSQLPYQHPELGWLLVTRDQVARWLEVEAEDDPIVVVDLSTDVRQLADDLRIGPVHPRSVAGGCTVTDVLAELEEALRQPDDQVGGYPAVLVVARDPSAPPRILAPDDLPHLYKVLGR